ncbi:HAMP domain-containing histidine kinase [Bacillus sp. BHET2]|uniref:HAMP domain-containing sensor histidine kinase n=1 Tax=Bacillus sp. BHET2 TaxID=2583818 RepID=UPI00110E6107|nr:HAMP domain-containing sensor histidine kinase [Bacillus sp. BHET2]TMU83456.1 HAMP domain-containing histidine kinase [Bacillus sp. BHET2]
MNLRKKLTMNFLSHFIIFLVVMIGLIITALVTLSFIISRAEMKSDFSRTSIEYLEHAIKIKGQEVKMNQDVKDSVKKNNGWLQVVRSTGHVIGRYNTPSELPYSYNFTDILSLENSHYRMKYWQIPDKDKSMVTIIYGEKVRSIEIKKELINMNVLPEINKKIQDYLVQNDAWIQIYNSKGDIIDGYAAPKDLSYTFHDLLGIKEEPWNSRYDISLFRPPENPSHIFVIGTKNTYYSPDTITDGIINRSFMKGFLIVSTILVILITFLGIWYGKKFGVPLLYMMKWINDMSEENYSFPLNNKGVNPLLNNAGTLNKKYSFFKDVVLSLNKLTSTLKMNEQIQQKMDKTREEWITGLSHDLKTPISSIYGYSTLLSTDSYKWSQKEMNEFGQIIKEKAYYMSELIEDLNLTYRLKNDALPIHKERIEIISFLKRWLNQHETSEKPIILETTYHSLYLNMDPKWLARIMNNLVVNAINHTPTGTQIKVTVLKSGASAIILIEDNGTGMDAETIQNLFNRYYRGGNTKDSDNGSGLGMAITHQLVVAHDGKVEVKSEPGSGTTIKLIFPYELDEKIPK